MEFKIGDRVRAVKSVDGRDELIGKTGVVAHINDGKYTNIGVDFDDKNFNGHNLNGHIQTDTGRYGRNEDFELISNVKGKKVKEVPIDKYMVIQDSCGNFIGIKNSYKEAEELAKTYNSNDMTIYKLTEVAKVSTKTERLVKKVKITKK